MRKIIALLLAAFAFAAGATVPSETNYNTYVCNGTQTVYPYTYKIFTDNDLVVTTLLSGTTTTFVKTTDYTVSGAGLAAGGNVTLTAGSKCANGATITIKRQIALRQPTSFRTQGTFSPAVHENAFDRGVMQAQQEERTRAAEDALIRAEVATSALGGGVNIADNSTVQATGAVISRTLSDHLSTLPDFRPTGSGAITPLKDHVSGWRNVRASGVKCDGVTDDRAAFEAAAADAVAEGATLLVSCKVRFTSSAVFETTANIRFIGGGSLDLQTGGSVVLSGSLDAPLSRIFWMNGGTLAFNSKVAQVYPQWWGAVGDGVTDDTAAIQAAITAGQSAGKEVVFAQGTYNYTSLPNLAVAGFRMRGVGLVVLHHTGTGNAVTIDAGAGAVNIFDVVLDNITISGNANTTNGLFIRGVHHGNFRDVRVTNVSAAGLLVNFSVLSRFENFTVSTNESTFTVQPVNGIVLDKRDTSESTASCTFINPIIEGVSGSGIKLVNAIVITIRGGTSEANARGIELLAPSGRNVIDGIDLEANSIEDVLSTGAHNLWTGLNSASLFHVSGSNNRLSGGVYDSITIDTNTQSTELDGVAYNISGSGAFTDNGNNTIVRRLHNAAAGLSDKGVLYVGSGVPSVNRGQNGDFYFRTDTPAVASQRIYQKAAGAWSAVLGLTNAPAGVSAITVTASPFTHTNADGVQEAIYISGGTVSDVAKNSVTLFAASPATVWLAPGEAVTVTYTVAPTMNKDLK